MDCVSFMKRLFFGLVSGAFICLVPVQHYTSNSLEKPTPTVIAVVSPALPVTLFDQKKTTAGLPVSLRIPRIGIDTKVEHLGMTPAGEMAAPQEDQDVAWFDLGPRPGDTGSAVIAGHLDGRGGKLAVFDKLSELSPGDNLSVEDDQGKTISFTIRSKHLYASGEIVPKVFSSESGTHLNLITCAGTWDASRKSYSQRLVIFADIVTGNEVRVGELAR
jgi:sortase (surface protein transpeptidase)